MSNASAKIIESIKLIAEEKDIPLENVTEALKDAISKAYIREFQETEVEVIVDLEKSRLEVYKLLKVVDEYEDLNDYNEISLKDARKIDAKLGVGDIYKEVVNLEDLERMVVAHIFQLFRHNITIETNKGVFQEWTSRVGEVVFAEVEKVDERAGFVVVNLGSTYGFLSNQEKIPTEILIPGQKYNFFIKEVKEQTKGWPVILSRADAGLVKYLLTLQVPELQEGVIEIKAIARIPAFKTKIALISHQSGVDPIGTCIGPKGSRIKSVTQQINDEKIDVILFDEDFNRYIINACSPAEIAGLKVTFDEINQRNNIIVVAREDQLPLLIGKRGGNVRLLSILLNANVEVKSTSDAANEGLEYEKNNVRLTRQRNFEKTTNKYSTNYDLLKQFDDSVDSAFNIPKYSNTYSKTAAPTNYSKPIRSDNAVFTNKYSPESKPYKNEYVETKKPILKDYSSSTQSFQDLENMLDGGANTKKTYTKSFPTAEGVSKKKKKSELLDVLNEFNKDDLMNQVVDSNESETSFNDIDEDFDETYKGK